MSTSFATSPRQHGAHLVLWFAIVSQLMCGVRTDDKHVTRLVRVYTHQALDVACPHQQRKCLHEGIGGASLERSNDITHGNFAVASAFCKVR